MIPGTTEMTRANGDLRRHQAMFPISGIVRFASQVYHAHTPSIPSDTVTVNIGEPLVDKQRRDRAIIQEMLASQRVRKVLKSYEWIQPIQKNRQG